MEQVLQPGDYLDHFQIKKVLHYGAMAQIYRAFDKIAGEDVALKVPFGDILNNRVLYYHFQNETRITRHLDHPNIVRFVDGDLSRQYSVMEYIPGRDLRTLFSREKKYPFEKVRPLIVQIARGLAYLHDMDVIHLDIKPENIMVTGDDAVKIIDFGLARKKGVKDLLAEDFLTPQGTPYYIAPEQIGRNRNEKRSDLYSMGMILYEALTGKLPFTRSNRLSRVKERLKYDPVPPRFYNPGISPQVQEIILKALEKNPEDRYSTVSAMKADLEDYESVAVTAKGLATEKPSHWQAFFKKTFGPGQIRDVQENGEGKQSQKSIPHILGAIVDHQVSDWVVDKVKYHALLSQTADVTLLTVIDPSLDSEFTQSRMAVAGDHFRKRINRYVALLQDFGIDPMVRIQRGDVVDRIVQLSQTLGVDLIIMGHTRKKGLKKMFGGSTLGKVLEKTPCNVVVADSERSIREYPIPFNTAKDEISGEKIVEIDLFLIDTWVRHINWLSDLTVSLIQSRDVAAFLDDRHCAFGKWIESLKKDGACSEILDLIHEPHKLFHQMALKMTDAAMAGDLEEMKRIYLGQALPQSSKIRKSLQQVSSFFREQAAFKAAGIPTFFQLTARPEEKTEKSEGDAVSKADKIRAYFSKHPDASPDICVSNIENNKKNERDTSRK